MVLEGRKTLPLRSPARSGDVADTRDRYSGLALHDQAGQPVELIAMKVPVSVASARCWVEQQLLAFVLAQSLHAQPDRGRGVTDRQPLTGDADGELRGQGGRHTIQGTTYRAL